MTTKVTAKISFPIYLVLISLTLSACAVESQERVLTSEKAQTELKFVQTVLLKNEYGGDGKVARYAGAVKVSAFRASPSEKQLLGHALQKINEALSGTSMSLTLIDDQNPSAQIRVYYARLREFPSIAATEGFPYGEGNTGYFWTFWNGRHEITRSVVMIATDALFGEELESVTLEEVTQSLGAVGDEDKIEESIFYETAWEPGFATELSALDVQTLRFLYTSVRAGDGTKEVTRAFHQTWAE